MQTPCVTIYIIHNMYISIYTCDIHHTVYYMLSVLWRLYNTHEIQKLSYVYTKTYTQVLIAN